MEPYIGRSVGITVLVLLSIPVWGVGSAVRLVCELASEKFGAHVTECSVFWKTVN